MKHFIFIISFLFFSHNRVLSQEDPVVKHQRIEALKIAFISQKLNLSTVEAEKFWPVYYKYESELKEVHKEANNMDVIDKDEKLLNIRKKYKAEFSNVLGAGRVNSLYKSENEFRAVLLRHIQHPNVTPRRESIVPPNKILPPNRR